MPHGPLTGWASVLVGHQWPDTVALHGLAAAAESRTTVSVEQDSYAQVLASIRSGELATQQGLAAEAVTQSFRAGETRSRDIAARNRAKARAYQTAWESVSQLQEQLATIAAAGEARIRAVLDSAAPAAEKTDRIVAIVTDSQAEANAAAARQAGNVVDAIQLVLDAVESGHHAREFAGRHGVITDGAFNSASHERIRAQVTAAVHLAGEGR